MKFGSRCWVLYIGALYQLKFYQIKLSKNASCKRSVYFSYSCISICLWKPWWHQTWVKLCKISLITFCHWSTGMLSIREFLLHTPQGHLSDFPCSKSILLLGSPVKDKQAGFHWVSDLHCIELNSEVILKGLTSTRTTTKQGSSKCKSSGIQGKETRLFLFRGCKVFTISCNLPLTVFCVKSFLYARLFCCDLAVLCWSFFVCFVLGFLSTSSINWVVMLKF